MNLREAENERVAAALRDAGFSINSIFDLVNSKTPYKEAIPVLISILPTIEDNWIRQGIVRSLAVKEAVGEPVSSTMIKYFQEIDDSSSSSSRSLKWAVGNTLSVVARDSVFSDLVCLLNNREHGKSREMLAVALANMKDPRAVDVLVELLDDDEVAGHAIMALGKLKAHNAAAKIEKFLDHPARWIRIEAGRALRKMGKSRTK